MSETESRGVPPILQARINFCEQRRAMVLAWRTWLELEPGGQDIRHELDTTQNLVEQVRAQVVDR